MTPNSIEVLIHCFVSQERHPRFGTPAVREAIDYLERNELIVPDYPQREIYRTTGKGEAHLRQLCALRFPTLAWKDYANNLIEG